MKKSLKFYVIAWLVLLAVFNVICFVTPSQISDVNKYETALFWVGYVGITLTFFGQLACACVALSPKNERKVFYRLSMVRVCSAGLVWTVILGAATMLLPQFISAFPTWAGVIVCVLVLAFTAIATVKAAAAVELVETKDAELKNKTQFVKLATADAQALLSTAATDEAKEACRQVYEALRYSDPMSNEALASAELEISGKLQVLTAKVASGDVDAVKATAQELLALIQARNAKCKALK